MKKIMVKNSQESCHHVYVQRGSSYTVKRKPFLFARFECQKCHHERVFAVEICDFLFTATLPREEYDHV